MAATIAFRRFYNSLPGAGDISQGAGLSTAQRSNTNALDTESFGAPLGTTIAPSAHGAPWLQPVPVWIAFFALLVAAKYVAEKNGNEGEFSTIRVGFYNIFVIWAVAVLSINLGKWIFGYWRLPGISALALAA
jgi:hypothetical protein